MLQPVFLSINLKTFQGTIKCRCEHENCSIKHIPPLAHQKLELNSKLVQHMNPNFESTDSNSNSNATYKLDTHCPYASEAFCSIVLECLKLNANLCRSDKLHSNVIVHPSCDMNINTPTTGTVIHKNKSAPTVSINVIDAENLNICMCSLYASCDNVPLEHDRMIGTICPRCQNIIKQQPTEHRKTLISKRLTLSKDIIVNRVDTHFLSLKTAFDHSKRYEPYTPESVESHSPLPEPEPDLNDFEQSAEFTPKLINHTLTNETNEDILNKNTKTMPNMRTLTTHSSAVSPRQLKSRLEILRKTSTDASGMVISSHIIEDRKNNTKRGFCFSRCCVIL